VKPRHSEKQAEEARVQALAADAVRTQLERAQGEYNFVLAKKYAYPGTIQLLDGVTRVLPDDTWVTQLEMRTSLRGKLHRSAGHHGRFDQSALYH